MLEEEHYSCGSSYFNVTVAGAARRGALQLWQFLVTLLDDPTNSGKYFLADSDLLISRIVILFVILAQHKCAPKN